MQRKEEGRRRAQLEKERTDMLNSFKWAVGTKGSKRNASGSDSDSDEEEEEDVRPKFIPGRRSYGGFNTKVENLVSEAKAGTAADEAEEETVSNEQMASRYGKYVGLRGTPKKKGKQNTHKKFKSEEVHAKNEKEDKKRNNKTKRKTPSKGFVKPNIH